MSHECSSFLSIHKQNIDISTNTSIKNEAKDLGLLRVD
jgi:hypothetical protein